MCRSKLFWLSLCYDSRISQLHADSHRFVVTVTLLPKRREDRPATGNTVRKHAECLRKATATTAEQNNVPPKDERIPNSPARMPDPRGYEAPLLASRLSRKLAVAAQGQGSHEHLADHDPRQRADEIVAREVACPTRVSQTLPFLTWTWKSH